MRMMNFPVDETLEVEESKEEMEATAFLCDLCGKDYKTPNIREPTSKVTSHATFALKHTNQG